MKREYVEPELNEVGSLVDLTHAVNKKHSKADQYTAATGGNVIGSVYPVS